MNKQVKMAALSPVIQELLAGGSTVQLTVTGYSMWPMLMHRRDQVELAAVSSKLCKYDIPLYQRDNGDFILHRIIKIENDGTYTCVGDGQTVLESGICHDQIVAVVYSFTRKGKKISCQNKGYQVYAVLWSMLLSVRPILLKIIRGIGKAKYKFYEMKNKRKRQ